MPQARSPRAGVDNAHAALAQNVEIGLHRRMLPHVHVHRRSNKNRRARGEIHRRQKIVGDTLRKFRQNIGGRRSDNQRLSPLRFTDVFD